MSWHQVTSAGASRDLWLDVTGHDRPEYGRWTSPAGLDVAKVLGEHGPAALDIKVWWEPPKGHQGRRLTDFIWQTGGLALKVVSEELVAVLRDQGAELEIFELDVRTGEPLTGYVGMLEATAAPGPVHSLWRGRRSDSFVASDAVVAAIKAAGLAGIRVEPVAGPFPADEPGFFDDDLDG